MVGSLCRRTDRNDQANIHFSRTNAPEKGEPIIQTHKRNPTTYKAKWIVAKLNYNYLCQNSTAYDINSLLKRNLGGKTGVGGDVMVNGMCSIQVHLFN